MVVADSRKLTQRPKFDHMKIDSGDICLVIQNTIAASWRGVEFRREASVARCLCRREARRGSVERGELVAQSLLRERRRVSCCSEPWRERASVVLLGARRERCCHVHITSGSPLIRICNIRGSRQREKGNGPNALK